MIIAELAKYNDLPKNSATPYAPFTYVYYPLPKFEADFYTSFLGLDTQITNETTYIKEVVQGTNTKYTLAASLALCVTTEKSFFWDDDNQALYIHIDHDYYINHTDLSFISTIGFTNETIVYIGDSEYLPLMQKAPKIKNEVDILNYNKPNFLNGKLQLINNDSNLDYLINNNIYGYSVWTYYLPSEQETYTRDDLQPIATYYIEDYDISTNTIDIRLQDPRKAQNINILQNTFTTTDYPDLEDKYKGAPVPLAYGADIRIAKAIPVNGAGSGNVTYRVAEEVGSFSGATADVKVNDVWTSKTIASSDTSTGTFLLSSADARDETSGKPYDCRLKNFEGISITYVTDIIKDLNNRALNITFDDTFYDITGWSANEADTGTGNIVFSDNTKLFEAIQDIQNGAMVNFRYAINAEGKRSIKIDDWESSTNDYIHREDILNITDITVKTDHKSLAAEVIVKYLKDFNDNKYISIKDSSCLNTVRTNYRQAPLVEIETILNNDSDAQTKATNYLERYATIRGTVELTVIGTDFFTVTIYDLINIELTPGFVDIDQGDITGRAFYGVWKAQVLGVMPDFENNTATIKAVLIEKIF